MQRTPALADPLRITFLASGLAEVVDLTEEPFDLVREQPVVFDGPRGYASALEKRLVMTEADEPEIGEPGLARSEELALSAYLEIALGKLEAVGCGHHRLEPLHGSFGELFARA